MLQSYFVGARAKAFAYRAMLLVLLHFSVLVRPFDLIKMGNSWRNSYTIGRMGRLLRCARTRSLSIRAGERLNGTEKDGEKMKKKGRETGRDKDRQRRKEREIEAYKTMPKKRYKLSLYSFSIRYE